MSPEQVEAIVAICERGRQSTIQSASLPADLKLGQTQLAVEKRISLLKSKDLDAQVKKTRDRVISTRDSIMREIAENLNKRQRAIFDKMLGEKFEFPKMMEKRENGEDEGRPTESSPADRDRDQSDQKR